MRKGGLWPLPSTTQAHSPWPTRSRLSQETTFYSQRCLAICQTYSMLSKTCGNQCGTLWKKNHDKPVQEWLPVVEKIPRVRFEKTHITAAACREFQHAVRGYRNLSFTPDSLLVVVLPGSGERLRAGSISFDCATLRSEMKSYTVLDSCSLVTHF